MTDTTSDTKPFNLRLPADVVEQVDARAKNLGYSRNQWFENMTRWVLESTYTIEQRGGRP
jgi:predicted HicB family RNase H-like nuclease